MLFFHVSVYVSNKKLYRPKAGGLDRCFAYSVINISVSIDHILADSLYEFVG